MPDMPGHTLVRNDNVDIVGGGDPDSRCAFGCKKQVIVAPKHSSHRIQYSLLVVHEQNAWPLVHISYPI